MKNKSYRFNKRIVISVLMSLTLIISFVTATSITANAQNNVSYMDVSVVINDDGSADITQKWTGTFDSGTESYLSFNNLGESEISNFKVSDQNGVYEVLNDDDWDVDASFEEKSKKCGLRHVSGGYELCWGLSQYGDNVYTFSYNISKLVAGYTDGDGFNFQFVHEGLAGYPSNARITLSLANGTPLADENADIWGFGYHGDIIFNSGKVIAQTSEMLEQDDGSSMIVMMRLNKNIIKPIRITDNSFNTIKDTALGGSDYSSENNSDDLLLVIAAAILVALGGIIILILVIRRKMQIKKIYKNSDYYRGTPNDYQLPNSYWLCKNFDINTSDSSIIGAVMLKLMNDGCIEPTDDVSVGFMGREKKSVSLHMIKQPAQSDVLGNMMYQLMSYSAGPDMILQEKELEGYVRNHPDMLRNIINAATNAGSNSLQLKGCFKGSPSNSVKNLTPIGMSELMQLMGLKKYLTDFSLISERTIEENAIWREYLVYATLMGIADKTIEQFKKVYPDRLPEITTYEYNMLWIASYHHACYNSMHAAEMAQAARSSGSGGSSSFGGGGGFSGGGGGGFR